MKWGSGRFAVGQEQVLGKVHFTSCPCPGGQCCPSTQPQPLSPPQDHSHQGRARALQLLCSRCHFSLQQLHFSPAESPSDFAPCQEKPNAVLDLLLFVLYCPWLGRLNFLGPPTPDQRVSQERAAWQILPKTIPALPAYFALLEVWPPSSLQYICCNFPFKHPTGKNKTTRGGGWFF